MAINDVTIGVGLDNTKAIQQWDETVNHIENTGNKLNSTLVAGLAATAGAFLGVAVKNIASEGIEFNSSMVAARRTFDLTQEEVKAMGDEILALAPKIGLLPNELALISIEAGKMGVAIQDVGEFGKTLGQLASISDLSVDKYSAFAGRIEGVYQMGAEGFREFGASVNALDDIIGGTSYNIFKFTARVSATGKIAGLTAGEVAAFGSVFEKVGVPAERAGTAFETFIQTLQTLKSQPPEVQRAFTELYGEGSMDFIELMETDAPAAVTQFLQKIKEIPSESERMRLLLQLFGKASSSELAAIAERADLVKKAIELANDEIANTAKLEREIDIKADDPAFKLKQLTAEFNRIGVQLGLALIPPLNQILEAVLPIARGFADWVSKNPELAKIGISVAAISAVALPLIGIIGGVSAALGSIGAISLPIAPILGTAAAIGAIGVALTKVKPDILSGVMRDRASESRQAVNDWGKNLSAGLKDSETSWQDAGANLVTSAMEGIDSLTSQLWEKVSGIGSILSKVGEKVGSVLGFESEQTTTVDATQKNTQMQFTYAPDYTIQVIDERSIVERLTAYLRQELTTEIEKAKLYQQRTAL